MKICNESLKQIFIDFELKRLSVMISVGQEGHTLQHSSVLGPLHMDLDNYPGQVNKPRVDFDSVDILTSVTVHRSYLKHHTDQNTNEHE